MTSRAEAHSQPAPIPDHVQAMETALKLLHAAADVLANAPATVFDLGPLARVIERAVSSLLDGYDARRDPLTAIRDAMVACDEAEAEIGQARIHDAGLAGVAAWLRAARDWLQLPETTFSAAHVAPARARTIMASRDLPVLQRLDRSTISPHIRVAKPLPPRPEAKPPLSEELSGLPMAERMATLKERSRSVREEAARKRDASHRAREARRTASTEPEPPPPGFTKAPRAALTPSAVVRARARDLFSDIAAMGLQRTPLLGDFWRGANVFDQRLLRDIDAFAALGGEALAHVEGLVFDSPAKDASCAFAIGMLLGCFEGRDALSAVDRGIRFLGTGEPAIVVGLQMGLKLAPHPDLPTVLRQWLKDDDAALRATAIAVLAHHGRATTEELLLACQDPEELVAASAFVPAALLDIPDLGAMIERRAEAKTKALRDALAWATVLGSTSYPLDRLRKQLDTDAAEHVLLPIALAGDESDAAHLVERFTRKPSRAHALSLGFSGHPSAIAALIDALESDVAPELKEACAFALQRLTGAELYDDVDVAPEDLDTETPDDPPLPDAAPPPLKAAGDRRDRPARGAPDRMTLPTTQPGAWRQFVAAEALPVGGTQRLRRGKPFTPVQSLQEIDTYQITPSERRTLYWEIVIKTGKAVPFDPGDFVSVQEAALNRLAPICEKAGSMPGAWGRALRS